MPNLHAHYYHGNLKAFRQELDGTGGAAKQDKSVHTGGGGGAGSASLGKSWTLSGHGQNQVVKADPNERDNLGRTVLHVAATSSTQQSWSFFLVLLRNPHISVNLQDTESGYTALHRALFAGNIRAARELLLRNDIDPAIRDMEGMTAFELYNGTVDGTNPASDVDGTDLFVWGVNRNFALGTGDSSDKAFPDRVNLLTQRQASDQPDPAQRFHHVGVRDVVMAKLHTGVVTTEPRGNLSLCGFGSNGRLGRTVHSQLSLLPLSDLQSTITQIALGQDHTLALTSGGYILSWGHNRFSQLGYVIDLPDRPAGLSLGKDDPDLQVSPRRIVGPLKKEWVKGVAAGRLSSAAWTEDTVWTWGTNTGQLGYEKAANPVQVLPRKVTQLSQAVVDISLSDYAMVCLLDNLDVLCFHHDTTFKISFSTPRILSDAFPFRPPQSTLKPSIKKVTCCGSTFAALSSIGDVFTFSLPNPMEDSSKEGRDRHVTVKPQLIWALRKRFTAVKDVALGSDGTVIICTHAGHVFVRQRTKAGSGSLKFKHIPYLQRIIKVATNESGAFAAIRVDAKPRPIALTGKTLEEDLFLLQPHFQRFQHQMTAADFEAHGKPKVALDEEEEDEGSNSVVKDIAISFKLCTILRRWRSSDTDSLFSWSEPLLGSDVFLVVNGMAIPAHRSILCLRSPIFDRLFAGGVIDRFSIGKTNKSAIVVDVCHPLVVLLLMQYIYSDDVAAIWDTRVLRAIQEKYADLKLPHAQIKADLRALADILALAPLASVLDSAGKSPIAHRTLPADVQAFFNKTCAASQASASVGSVTDTDITLLLAEEKEVHCSSIILRSRCPFFEAMFADNEWTASRHEGKEGRVVVRMTHLKWRPMKLVFRFLHEGTEDDLFDYLHQETMDEFLDFVFEVMAAATELLLDRLVLVCSRVIIRHCTVYNAASLASEANFYQATTLKHSIFDYILSSMETMLESGLLDDMDEETLADLSKAVESAQSKKLPISRNGVLVHQAMEKQKEWLALQDIPQPRVRAAWKWRNTPLHAKSPGLSPVDPFYPSSGGKEKRRVASSPIGSPEIAPIPGSSTVDDIFTMDEERAWSPATRASGVGGRGTPTPKSAMGRPITPLDLSAGPSKSASGGGPVWRSSAVDAQRVDLRSVMAEAATKTPSRPHGSVAPTKTSAVSGSGPGLFGAGQRIGIGASSSSLPSSSSKPATLSKSPPFSTGWRAVDTAKTSLSAVQAQQGFPPPSSTARTSISQASPIPNRTPSASASSSKGARIAGQAPSAGITPRKSSGPAWTASTPTTSFAPSPRSTPTPTLSASSPSASTSLSFSLLAIQQEEQDYADRSQKKPVKSMMQIQKEERERQEAQVQEEEFMRWWVDEEARMARENGEGAAGAGSGAGAARGKAGRGRGGAGGVKRVPPNRGRGGKSGTGPGGGGRDVTPRNVGHGPAALPANGGEDRSRRESGAGRESMPKDAAPISASPLSPPSVTKPAMGGLGGLHATATPFIPPAFVPRAQMGQNDGAGRGRGGISNSVRGRTPS